MVAPLQQQVDILFMDSVAYALAIHALAMRLGKDERATAFKDCREALDSLSADPGVTEKGHRFFPEVETRLARIFQTPQESGASPRPDF